MDWDCSFCNIIHAVSLIQRGHRNPAGHREANRYSRQASSSGKRCWNSTIDLGKAGRPTCSTWLSQPDKHDDGICDTR
jgi:hypothetical protein